jgi:hypothetical protein
MIPILVTTLIGLFVYSELIDPEITQDGGDEYDDEYDNDSVYVYDNDSVYDDDSSDDDAEDDSELVKAVKPKVPRDSESSENWHNQCKEEKDLISQETWKDSDMTDPDMDIIFIKWDPTRKEECYNANDIETFKDNKDIHVVEWVHNGASDLDSLSTADKNSGMGYAPKKGPMVPVYMKLWPLDNYVSIKSVEKMLNSEKRHFIAKEVGSKRIGNTKGTRGVSEVHGQMPESKLYELIEK